MKNHISGMKKVSVGIKQGSLLSCTLFITFINDLAWQIPHIFMYADDTTSLSEKKEDKNLTDSANEDLEILKEWFLQNKLILNKEKSKSMIFNKRRNATYANPKIGNEEILLTEFFKLVGITIDDQLTYKEHIRLVQNKTSMFCGLLARSKRRLSKKLKILFFNACIMSHIRYGISVWGGASIKPLQKVLKKAVRYIESTHYTAHTDPIFAKLNILKVEDIWKQSILKIALI